MKEVTKDIYYVGVSNPTLRIFDIIMETKYGTTYNAYLIKDSNSALVDAVHERFADNYIQNIEEILPVSSIKYLICNHTEPDHTGSIAKLLRLNPDITIVATAAGIKNITQIVNAPFKFISVKDGDELDLGNTKLKFIFSPNLHWPDTMFTYIQEKRIVFTCDFLGTHYAEMDIFDKDLKYPEKYKSVIKDYYDAVMGPFKPWILKGLDRLSELEFDIVATSHGPILTEYIGYVMDLYRSWAQESVDSKSAVIAYVSAYGYTKKMAEAFEKELNALGIKTRSFDIIYSSMQDIVSAIERSKLILIGSPTINRDALKPVWDVLSNLSPLITKGKIAFAFGSYGWSGEACPNIESRLKSLGFAIGSPYLRVLFSPSQNDYETISHTAKMLVNSL
ncbi:MAG TPA: FprA family A-type flavoprotein [Clostridia bacterium]